MRSKVQLSLVLTFFFLSVSTAVAEPRYDLRAVQAALTEAGYDPGPVDGLPGTRTTAAIERFRADRGIGRGSTIDEDLLRELNIARTDSSNTSNGGPETRLNKGKPYDLVANMIVGRRPGQPVTYYSLASSKKLPEPSETCPECEIFSDGRWECVSWDRANAAATTPKFCRSEAKH
jgi:hypothetical protein